MRYSNDEVADSHELHATQICILCDTSLLLEFHLDIARALNFILAAGESCNKLYCFMQNQTPPVR